MKPKYQILVLALAALVLLGTAAAFPQQQMTITDGPRIEDVSDHSAEIAWTTSTGGSSVIRYGTDPNNLNQIAESGYAQSGTGSGQHGMHRVRIGNLQPNTTYYFVVDSGQGQGSGGEVRSQVGQFTTSGSGGSDKVPLYRAVSPSGTHLFTTSYQEYRNVISHNGFHDEGIAGYIDRKQGAGTQPLYHLYRSSNDDHLYTTNPSERESTIASGAYKDSGIAGYVATQQQPGTVPLYRMINANGQHFYTADPGEHQRDLAIQWKDEGVVGYVWPH
jgi:Purple acid Phosphatase, N-terminal domain/Repeat of unknown function (DUF5648)